MTDIASDDGGDNPQSPTKSADLTSRPGTGRTGTSSQRQSKKQNYASGLSAKRGSVTSGNPGPSARPVSKASRSHVPSLTSNAFFRPLSSQKLQAQRGGAGSRPPTTMQTQQQQYADLDDNATDLGGSVVPPMPPVEQPIAQVQRQMSDDENMRPPPSRGTEVTEQDTYGRVTANTSPTNGHYPAGSLSDSVRPLRKKSDQSRGLSVNVDKSYKDRANQPSPIKSPRSFRSSFLIPGKNDQEQRNRSTEGAEKLSSAASSPGLHPMDSQGRPRQNMAQLLAERPSVGKVFEYFEGNTRFFMGGRWQNTRQRPVNIATGVFAVVPCILFFAFEAPWLWHNISPAIPIIFAYLTYICISSFIHASVSDPGVSGFVFSEHLRV